MNWLKTIILLLFTFFTSCQTTSYRQVYIDLTNQEISSFAKEVKQSDGLHMFGYAGCFLEGIGNLSITFMSPESLTVEEARLQFYNVSRWFLNCINENESLKPYLVDDPFTIDNLALYIIYSQQIPGRVSGVTMGETLKCLKRPNKVYYYGYDSTETPIKIYEESYEEGLEIVRKFQNKNPAFLLYPRSFSYPLKYLDKNKWISETLRTERNAFGDNFMTRPNKEDEK